MERTATINEDIKEGHLEGGIAGDWLHEKAPVTYALGDQGRKSFHERYQGPWFKRVAGCEECSREM